jgi:hypothetical protein
MLGIPQLAQNRLAFQEGLWSMESVSKEGVDKCCVLAVEKCMICLDDWVITSCDIDIQ